jgi:hypothetical protein
MKQKYVPLEKRSKREQREYHAMQRKSWSEVNPITRAVPSKKVYNRKKSVQRWGNEPLVRIFYFIGFYIYMIFEGKDSRDMPLPCKYGFVPSRETTLTFLS